MQILYYSENKRDRFVHKTFYLIQENTCVRLMHDRFMGFRWPYVITNKRGPKTCKIVPYIIFK